MSRVAKVLTALSLPIVAMFLINCGGGGLVGGGGFAKQPGIYIVDEGNNQIVWSLDFNATFFTRFNSAVTGVTDILNGTVGKNGGIYVIDSTNKNIVRFSNLAGDGKTTFGSVGSGVGQFLNPVRVAVDSQGRLLVVDRDRNELIRWAAPNGNWETLDLSTWFASSAEPDVTTDGFGHIFVAGATKIVQLNGMTATGAQTYGAPGTGTGEFNAITGIALDDSNRIYVADGANDRIVRINNISGAGFVAFGSPGSGVGQFDIPFGIGIDHNGKVYVSDRNNHRVVRFETMTGTNWAEMPTLPGGGLSFPLSIFPHLPNW